MFAHEGTTDEVEVFSDADEDDGDEESGVKEMRVPINLPRPDGHPFDIFDLIHFTWSTQSTSGILKEDIPNLGTGSTLSYHKNIHAMYLYGGWNERRFSSDVYCISMNTWKWEKVEVPKGEIKPSPRYLTGVLLHKDRLCNFGGVGPNIVDGQDEGAEYHGCIEGNTQYQFGWNNEYYEFDLIKRRFENRCVIPVAICVLHPIFQ